MGLDHISQVVQKEVREGYLGTNQGLVVSMAICNLHAMAEGAKYCAFDQIITAFGIHTLVTVCCGENSARGVCSFWN